MEEHGGGPAPLDLGGHAVAGRELEDDEQALEWNRRGVEAARQIHAPDFEIEGNARLNLADNLRALGRLDEAEEELGDVLFAAAAVARKLGVDPESALRRTTRRFALRYERMLERAREEGVDLASLPEDELLAYFREVRR